MFSSNLYVPFAGHQTRVALPIKMTDTYVYASIYEYSMLVKWEQSRSARKGTSKHNWYKNICRFLHVIFKGKNSWLFSNVFWFRTYCSRSWEQVVQILQRAEYQFPIF